jgi:nucleotide-binding universal stress UspA family protein
MMVLMALVTTFMTTPLLHLIYPPERLTTELLEQAEPAARPVAAPAFTVLVCVAQDRSGPGLIMLASALGNGPSRLYALGLVPMTERGSAYIDSSPVHEDGSTLEPLLARASELKLDVKPLSFVSADPGRDICDVAQVKGADLVLLGWHRPLFAGSRLGGVVSEVMKEAGSDVGVFVDRGLQQVRRGRTIGPRSPSRSACCSAPRRKSRSCTSSSRNGPVARSRSARATPWTPSSTRARAA